MMHFIKSANSLISVNTPCLDHLQNVCELRLQKALHIVTDTNMVLIYLSKEVFHIGLYICMEK